MSRTNPQADGEVHPDVVEQLSFQAAQTYVGLGYPIVLLYGVRGEACACREGVACRNAGKHPIGSAWKEKAIRTKEELARRWKMRRGAPTNIGLLLTEGMRLLLIDEDNKNGKNGAAVIADWERKLGIRFDDFLVQHTPTGGKHYLMRIPAGYTPGRLPNGAVLAGVDVLRSNRQFVLSPSVRPDGRYTAADGAIDVSLPPPDDLLLAPTSLLDHLADLAARTSASSGPAPELASLLAPSIERLRQVAGYIPNGEDVPREKYVWVAHAIKGAAGKDDVAEGREIFLDWASKYPDADPDEDARVFDTIKWADVRTGWDESSWARRQARLSVRGGRLCSGLGRLRS